MNNPDKIVSVIDANLDIPLRSRLVLAHEILYAFGMDPYEVAQ